MRSTENIELLFRNLGADWASITPEEFAAQVEELHGIHIEFVEMPLPRGYFGACMVVVEEEESPTGFVFYAPKLQPTQREHVKMHEVAHIALQHNIVIASYEQLEKIQRNPKLLTESNLTIACRATNSSGKRSKRQTQEDEAELLTRLIFEQRFLTRQKNHLARASSLEYTDEALRRMGIA